jgi:hypothetical protein
VPTNCNRINYEKEFRAVHPAGSLTGFAHADDAAIKQSLAKLGVTGSDIQHRLPG